MAFVLASYSAAATLHASGFLAVYLTALALGNARLPHRRATLGFADGLAWLAQIGLFVMLGLLAVPSRLGNAVLPALLVGGVLVLLARPLSVLLAMPGRFGAANRTFVAAAGLRGAVPIVLATIPMTNRIDGATRLFDMVVVLVGLLTLLQAPALQPLARVLRVAGRDAGHDLDVEAAPLDRLAADLLTVRVGAGSRLHGVEVWELRLPVTASVAYVVRQDRGFVPDDRTVLKRGDDLLVITGRESRALVEDRITEIGRSGRLAGFVTPTRTRRR
jgi:cell volume regulation protein A